MKETVTHPVKTNKQTWWRTELLKTRKCNKREDNLRQQLKDLIEVANHFGFYNAADFLKNQLKGRSHE